MHTPMTLAECLKFGLDHYFYHKLGQNFLLVDLQEFFSNLGWGDGEKRKKTLKMTS